MTNRFFILSDRAGFSRVLCCNANIDSGFRDCGCMVCLTTSDCRRLLRTGVGRYLREVFNAHTRASSVLYHMDRRLGGQPYAVGPSRRWQKPAGDICGVLV